MVTDDFKTSATKRSCSNEKLANRSAGAIRVLGQGQGAIREAAHSYLLVMVSFRLTLGILTPDVQEQVQQPLQSDRRIGGFNPPAQK